MKFLGFYALVIITSYFSDNIFIVYYIFPAFILSVLLLIFSSGTRKYTSISLAVLLFSSLAGHIIFRLVINSGYISIAGGSFFNKANIISGTKNMFTQYFDMLKSGGLNRLIMIYFLLSLVLLFYIDIRIIIKNSLMKEKEKFVESIYFLFSGIFLISVFLAPALSGNYTGYDTIRYNLFVFIVALANSGIILRRILRNKRYEKLVLYTISGFLMLTSAFHIIKAASNMNPPALTFNYKPEIVKVLDYVHKEYDLKNGVGTYWNAKLASPFMGKSIRLYQVNENIYPDYFINNPNAYYHINKNDSSPPVFNYIVDNDEDINMSVMSKLFNHKQKLIYYRNRIIIFQVPDFIFTSENEPYLKILN